MPPPLQSAVQAPPLVAPSRQKCALTTCCIGFVTVQVAAWTTVQLLEKQPRGCTCTVTLSPTLSGSPDDVTVGPRTQIFAGAVSVHMPPAESTPASAMHARFVQATTPP